MKKLTLLLLPLLFSSQNYSQTKTVNINFNDTDGFLKDVCHVNRGPYLGGDSHVAGYVDLNMTLVRAHDYSGPCDYWHYTDFYDYFTGNFDYSFDPYDPNDYTWTPTDDKIDELLSTGALPFYRLGISYPPGGGSPASPMPKDSDGKNFTTFASICKQTVAHFNDGWAGGSYNDFEYWEIWNEPNLPHFWTVDSAAAYWRMYHQAADSIKLSYPTVKVGGPGMAMNGIFPTHKTPYFDDFIEYCDTASVPLDFFSWHFYDKRNPYCLKNFADTVRWVLDQNHFLNTEIIVSEIHYDLMNNQGYQNSAQGAAFAASLFITAQESLVDKLFWYDGVGLGSLTNSDMAGNPDLTWEGDAFKAMNFLVIETPVKLDVASNNEVVNHNYNNASVTNFMTAAGRTSSGDSVYVLVSNYNTSYSTVDISLTNLPWTSSDNIEVTINTLQGSNKFTQTTTNQTGGSSLVVNLASASSPAVFLVRLVKSEPVLAVDMGTLNAYAETEGVQLEWTAEGSTKGDLFEVQRAETPSGFTTIRELVCPETGLRYFEMLDTAPLLGEAYYRIIQKDEMGQTVISNIASINWHSETDITVFPNPVVGNEITVKLSNLDVPLQVSVFNPLGKTMLTELWKHPMSDNKINLAGLPSGVVFMVLKQGGKVQVERIILP